MRKPKSPPRRTPRQSRARSTVEVILQAGARVLVEEGYERATTKRIAEVAGVSIGSLYQYFPGKDEIVAELADLRGQQTIARLLEASASPGAESLEAMVRTMVRAFIAAYRDNPAFFRRLLEEAPHLREVERLASAQRRVESMVAAKLATYPEVRPRNLDLAAFVITRAVRAVVWDILVERPEMLTAPELIEELTTLAVGYLRRT